MITVGSTKQQLAGLDDSAPLAVVFYRKNDAEEILNKEITDNEWERMVGLWDGSDYLFSETNDLIRYCYKRAKEAVRS